MLIFKSFFRKKTTKVYLTLFSLLLFSIILLLSFKEYYVSLLKENYKESYLGLVADKKEINKLKKMSDFFNENGIFDIYTNSKIYEVLIANQLGHQIIN